MKTQLLAATLTAALAASAFGACAKSAEPRASATTSPPAAIHLPATPTGEPVLDISPAAGAAPQAVDFATLDGLATRSYTVMEPFEKKRIAFRGVELWSVLRAAGMATTAKTVHLIALDDYKVELPVADVRKGGVILATRADGQRIPVDHGGPSRIVFLDGVAAGANPDQWIWSVSHITVS